MHRKVTAAASQVAYIHIAPRVDTIPSACMQVFLIAEIIFLKEISKSGSWVHANILFFVSYFIRAMPSIEAHDTK